MQMNFETQGVNFVALTDYVLIYDAKAIGDLTAAVNSDLMNVLAEKLDPSILDAAHQAASTVSDIANSVSTLS
ncbi:MULTISPECIES: hypothetical protein [Shewanella]|uniref:Uncharacterized protein n=1 Tax=Shewanella salipaludis TaxID=2723052 RepID=A0A972JNZ7_9GAMM|nr:MULTISPECIES: hypothetical protein [Shewanella]MCE9687106.1 hypothetical protein [Shewanella sp. AS16]MCE9687108.1 hypothetical protein [Shewanella sp. AS16]MCE9687109.1 hypothetical protein [Shewanella sp. AS16]NMH66666.1 hypothetical protein [Shewanella salipaludis]